ncbi:MAG: efflux RND transporter periplasmic adaptor subunit [Prochloraceae cyanobacterium]|nr:efflux RND transporter periplasmic adaptor subunit [Prochloraceae cyanobacterium]
MSEYKQPIQEIESYEVAPNQSIVALGRIEPKEIIKVSAANPIETQIDRLYVSEGDRVKEGQLIATLKGIEKKQAAVVQGQKNVELFQARLRQAKIGANTNKNLTVQKNLIEQLKAQLETQTLEREAAIDLAKAQLNNTESEYNRYKQLSESGAISASDLDLRRTNLFTSRSRLNEAIARKNNTKRTLIAKINQETAKLKQISAVRSLEVQIAAAELEYALAELETDRVELEELYVRAPKSGQILQVNSNVGESVNSEAGIVELARTEQMYAIAEVYESDIFQVRVGQQAIVTSENGGLSAQLKGRVEAIGLQIKKTDALDTDPAADRNARVVEVKISLNPEDSIKVAGLTYLQIKAKIQLNAIAQR